MVLLRKAGWHREQPVLESEPEVSSTRVHFPRHDHRRPNESQFNRFGQLKSGTRLLIRPTTSTFPARDGGRDRLKLDERPSDDEPLLWVPLASSRMERLIGRPFRPQHQAPMSRRKIRMEVSASVVPDDPLPGGVNGIGLNSRSRPTPRLRRDTHFHPAKLWLSATQPLPLALELFQQGSAKWRLLINAPVVPVPFRFLPKAPDRSAGPAHVKWRQTPLDRGSESE